MTNTIQYVSRQLTRRRRVRFPPSLLLRMFSRRNKPQIKLNWFEVHYYSKQGLAVAVGGGAVIGLAYTMLERNDHNVQKRKAGEFGKKSKARRDAEQVLIQEYAQKLQTRESSTQVRTLSQSVNATLTIALADTHGGFIA